jgi:hypothetical protein
MINLHFPDSVNTGINTRFYSVRPITLTIVEIVASTMAPVSIGHLLFQIAGNTSEFWSEKVLDLALHTQTGVANR